MPENSGPSSGNLDRDESDDEDDDREEDEGEDEEKHKSEHENGTLCVRLFVCSSMLFVLFLLVVVVALNFE